jgi:23S rRNA pseudouridine2605 synthase
LRLSPLSWGEFFILYLCGSLLLKNSKLLHMAQGFKKFMGKGDSGAKKKERIRQEKKKLRQETKEYFEKKKQEAREARAQGQAGGFQSERGRKEYGEKKAASYKAKGESNTGKAGFKGNETSRQRGNEQGTEASRHKGNRKTPGFKPQAASNADRAKSFKPKAGSSTGKAGFKGNEAARQQGNEKGSAKAASFKPQAAGNAGKTGKSGAQPQTTNNKPQTS